MTVLSIGRRFLRIVKSGNDSITIKRILINGKIKYKLDKYGIITYHDTYNSCIYKLWE